MPNFWDKVRRGLGDEDEDLSALVPGVDLEMASFTPQPPPPPVMPPSGIRSAAALPPPPSTVVKESRWRLPGLLPLGVTPYYREVYGTFVADGSNTFFFASPTATANTPLLVEQIPQNTYLVIRRFTPYILELWDSPTAPTMPAPFSYSLHFVATIESKISVANSNTTGFALINAAGNATVSPAGGSIATNDQRTQATSIFNQTAFDPDWSFVATPNESLVINIKSKSLAPFSFWGGGTTNYMAAAQVFGWWMPQAVYEQMVK